MGAPKASVVTLDLVVVLVHNHLQGERALAVGAGRLLVEMVTVRERADVAGILRPELVVRDIEGQPTVHAQHLVPVVAIHGILHLAGLVASKGLPANLLVGAVDLPALIVRSDLRLSRSDGYRHNDHRHERDLSKELFHCRVLSGKLAG